MSNTGCRREHGKISKGKEKKNTGIIINPFSNSDEQKSLLSPGGFFIVLVAQYFQHALCSLLFGVTPVDQFAVFIMFYYDVFWRWYQAMFYPAITTDLILVGAGMKKANI